MRAANAAHTVYDSEQAGAHMPTYDYRCVQCNTPFEASHAMNAPAPACPRCGGRAEKTILTAPAAHGRMAQGRELAMQALRASRTQAGPQVHGAGCRCCAPHKTSGSN